VLQQAGYFVTKVETLEFLSRELQETQDVAAVVLSENDPRVMEQAADVVRRLSKAPLILFRCSSLNINESKFDQVYDGVVAPNVWLSKTAELIAQSTALRERSARLRFEAQAVRQETERLNAQLRDELARNKPSRS
jgi:hypothetical protein